MQAIQAVQARQIGIQANVPVLPTAASQEGIETPLVSCYECDTVWHSTECTRCPRCARQVGTHWDLNEEETRELMSAVKLLDEERIERASEYEMWAFGNILRKHVTFYNETCPRTIQTCYEALLKQPSNLKIAFAMEFFKEAYLVAPEDEMMFHFDDEDEEDHYNSDVDEWW
jgi:NAD-dependent SIR2 family protein deacetylase